MAHDEWNTRRTRRGVKITYRRYTWKDTVIGGAAFILFIALMAS